MRFLSEIPGRGKNEKPYLLIPVGYPSDDCKAPFPVKRSVSHVL